MQTEANVLIIDTSSPFHDCPEDRWFWQQLIEMSIRKELVSAMTIACLYKASAYKAKNSIIGANQFNQNASKNLVIWLFVCLYNSEKFPQRLLKISFIK